MKLLIIAYDTGAESLVQEAFDRVGITGWTRIDEVSGKGRAGRRQGDPIFPGRNNMVITAIEDDQVEPLRTELQKIPEEFIKELPFRVIISDCDILI